MQQRAAWLRHSTHYYVQQVLPTENYIRWNPCLDVADAPDMLRTQPIKMDETDMNKLQAMNGYAKAYYDKNKQSIFTLPGM